MGFTFLCVHIFFFFNDTATTEIYTLSLHDALPICRQAIVAAEVLRRLARLAGRSHRPYVRSMTDPLTALLATLAQHRSEEHTSELQSQSNLVCRLLLEKKNTKQYTLCTLNIRDQ